MEQYIPKAALAANIEARYNECLQRAKIIDAEYWNGKADAYRDMLVVLNTLEVKEEPVSEELEEAVDEYAPDFSNSIASKAAVNAVRDAFKAGAKWQKENLWKPADGENLPEIDREVIVFTQNFPDDAGIIRVAIAHRPDPKGWDGKSIATGKVEHYTPKTYGKGGWNIPDVVMWLDLDIPKLEED